MQYTKGAQNKFTKHIRSENIVRWIIIIGSLMSVLASFFVYLTKKKDTAHLVNYYDLSVSRDSALRATRISLYKIDTLFYEIKQMKLSNEKLDNGSVIKLKLNDFEKRIANMENTTLGLRQAINPFKPDEILTIARLKDRINDLEKDRINLEKHLEDQQLSFQEGIKRELDNSSKTFTSLMLVLIPLVLNFLYTVWKDFRPKKEEVKNESKIV